MTHNQRADDVSKWLSTGGFRHEYCWLIIQDVFNHFVLTLSELFKAKHLLDQLSQSLFRTLLNAGYCDVSLTFTLAIRVWTDVYFNMKIFWKWMNVCVVNLTVLHFKLWGNHSIFWFKHTIFLVSTLIVSHSTYKPVLILSL